MHRVTVSLADGASDRLVLRRYVPPEQTTADPSVAAHEVAVLQLVERMETPTPHLYGVDPTGDAAGAPAVLMTELRGSSRVDRWPAVDAATRRRTRPVAAAGVRRFAVYSQSSYALATWVTKPAVWERAIEIHGPVLDDGGGGGSLDNLEYWYPGVEVPARLVECASEAGVSGFWIGSAALRSP